MEYSGAKWAAFDWVGWVGIGMGCGGMKQNRVVTRQVRIGWVVQEVRRQRADRKSHLTSSEPSFVRLRLREGLENTEAVVFRNTFSVVICSGRWDRNGRCGDVGMR